MENDGREVPTPTQKAGASEGPQAMEAAGVYPVEHKI